MPSAGESFRVLHVDDDPDFAEMAATFVEREDERFEVESATSASEGLERLVDDGFDCVVSDYDMPGCDGIEFLRSVREADPELPFILYTGKGSEEIASEAISAGVTDYLQKGSGTDHYALLGNRIGNYVEQTRARRERENMRERMQLTLNHTDSVIFEIDLDTGAVRRHGQFDQFFSVPSDDVPTWEDHLERAVDPDDREAFRQFYRQLADGERDGGTLEYRTNPDRGSVRWIRDDVYVEDGTSRQAIGLAQDITDHRERVQKREQIIERVTDAIVEVAADWRFTLVNEQAEELYDMDEEALLGRGFWDVFAGALETRFEDEYRKVMETREPTSFAEYYPGLDGWFEIQVYPNEDGGLAFYFREITERRERERERELAEARFRALAENFPNGAVHYFDDELRYQYVAGSGFDPIDTSASDLEGNTIYEVQQYSEDLVETLESLFRSTLAGGEEVAEITYKGRAYELRSAPIRDTDGKVTGGFFISQDVTDQRRRERELERQNERLEELTGFVSHDLRSPLAVAEGRLELAREDCDSEHLDAARGAVERSQILIDDLLSLARDGDRPDDDEPIRLADVARECWETVETADAALLIESNAIVRADHSRLRQLLENLFRNSVEHGSTGSRTQSDGAVEHSSTSNQRPVGADDDVEHGGRGTRVIVGDVDGGFYVEDDGPGIPLEDRARVFEMGYTTGGDSTGFGLAIVERVADAHGWRVDVTESEDGGARFEFTGVERE